MKLVKQLFVLIIISQLSSSCKGQDKDGVTYPKGKIMTTDKFDIEKYNKIVEEKKKKGEFDVYNHVEILPNGNVIESSQAQDKSSTIIISPPAPEIIQIYKSYHKNGFLEFEIHRYIGLAMGADEIRFWKSNYYDEKGQLVKVVDEMVKYENINVKPLNLFEILKKEPLFTIIDKETRVLFKDIFELNEKQEEITPAIVSKALKKDVILNPYDREDVKNVFLTLSEDKKTWNVTKDLYPYGQITLDVDTNTGKVNNKKYLREIRS